MGRILVQGCWDASLVDTNNSPGYFKNAARVLSSPGSYRPANLCRKRKNTSQIAARLMDPFFTVKSLNTTGNFYFFDDKTEKNYYPFKVQI